MPLALLPASVAPVTAPFAAPVTAPITTSRTTFFALVSTAGDERFLAALPARFLVPREGADFLAADFLLAFFDVNLFSFSRDCFGPSALRFINLALAATDQTVWGRTIMVVPTSRFPAPNLTTETSQIVICCNACKA
jgi:hypothetical protein